MKSEIIANILVLSGLLVPSSFGQEYDTLEITNDFKIVNLFIENITEANYLVILGDVPTATGELCPSRFKLESDEHKRAVQSYLTNLKIKKTEPPLPSHPSFHGQLRLTDFSISMVSVFDDHLEHFALCGPPLEVSLSTDESFWIESNNFDLGDFFDCLVLKGIKCDEIKYTGHPPQYIPSVILGSWYTEDKEIEIEFLDDGTFRFVNAPMSFCTQISKLPEKYRGFHLTEMSGRWTISECLLHLSLRNNSRSSYGKFGSSFRVKVMDDENLILESRNQKTQLIKRKK